MEEFAGLFERSGGKRKKEDYEEQKFSKGVSIATGLSSLKVVKENVKEAEWNRLVARSAEAVAGTRNVSFGASLSNAAIRAWDLLGEEEKADVGVSSGGTLIVESEARKALSRKYIDNPDYTTYQRMNALRFLEAITTMYSAFGRLLIPADEWQEQLDYNRGDIGQINRLYSTQVQEAREMTVDEDYLVDYKTREANYDAAAEAYAKEPTTANLEYLYKTLGKLKFKENAQQYADSMGTINQFKEDSEEEREKLRDAARAELIKRATGALGELQAFKVNEKFIKKPAYQLEATERIAKEQAVMTEEERNKQGISEAGMEQLGYEWNEIKGVWELGMEEESG